MAADIKRSIGMPLGELATPRKRPVITLVIIAVNIAVYAVTTYGNFFLEVADYWVVAGGFIPSLIATPSQWYRIFSSMFLHADFFHILFNMYFLYIFGKAVEEALGGLRFLILYTVSGVAASVFHTAFSFLGGATYYAVPAIGASGAISGVLGAYLILFPGTSLFMGFWLLPFFFFRLKASYYLIFWFATQLIYGFATASGSTAVFAHAGGFVAGIALLIIVVNRERIRQFRMARQVGFFLYPTFVSVKTGGLSRTTKAVVAVLLASLLAGAVYASIGLPNQGEVKSTTIQYALDGKSYVDYVGIQLSEDVESQISSVSLDETRILLSRLQAFVLLYNASRVDGTVHLENVSREVPIIVKIVTPPLVVYVNTAVNSFYGKYDSEGFLEFGEGSLTTRMLQFGIIGGNLCYAQSDPVTYNFEIVSQTVNLNVITQCTGVPSIFATVVALAVTVKKDKDLALIGEETETLRHPFNPFP